MATEEILNDYTIGEGFELPSGGQIYDTPVNPHVELRSMTARDEMKRLNPSSQPFKTLSDIIEGCMINKPAIHVYDMHLADYEYLLHKLRIVTYGPEYKMSLACQNCGNYVDAQANLEELELKEFDLDAFNALRSFALPRSQKSITLKIQSPHLLDTIDAKTKELKKKFKDANIDLSIQATLQTMIDTVDGLKLSPAELTTFINTLPALDLAKIQNNIEKMNQAFGLDNLLTIECPLCGGDIHTFFRFGSEFFRPTNI